MKSIGVVGLFVSVIVIIMTISVELGSGTESTILAKLNVNAIVIDARERDSLLSTIGRMTEEEWLAKVKENEETVRFVKGLSEETLLQALRILADRDNTVRDFE